MRLPNGYGSVYKLTGNRRRPWVVKKSIEGKQKALGYFVTQEEALTFLVGINRMTPEREVTFSSTVIPSYRKCTPLYTAVCFHGQCLYQKTGLELC